MNSETKSTPPNQGSTQPDYSIVIPVYFNEGSLATTMRNLISEVIEKKTELSCEVIFVDDGSGDNSYKELLHLFRTYPQWVKVIKLTRNFGQVSAITAGYRISTGKCVITISADGQDPPELINEMLDIHLAGTEIVIATREDREESKFRILSSRVFYELMRRLSFSNMPVGGFDFFLMGRRPLEAMLKSNEAHPFLQGQVLWTGFPVKFVNYSRKKREVGKSRWSFGKKLTYLLDGVLSYSFFPIRIMSAMGGLAALSGFIYAIVILLDKLVWGNPVKGWAPIMIVLLVVTGVQLLMLGVIGEYLWRTLAQVRQREPYIIQSIHE